MEWLATKVHQWSEVETQWDLFLKDMCHAYANSPTPHMVSFYMAWEREDAIRRCRLRRRRSRYRRGREGVRPRHRGRR